jgi:hypothetical protein
MVLGLGLACQSGSNEPERHLLPLIAYIKVQNERTAQSFFNFYCNRPGNWGSGSTDLDLTKEKRQKLKIQIMSIPDLIRIREFGTMNVNGYGSGFSNPDF